MNQDSQPEIEGLIERLYRSAFNLDASPHYGRTAALMREAAQALSALLSLKEGGGLRSQSQPVLASNGQSHAELSAAERHELECLRHQVGQLEYPCSPHCEGYLRELAMRNGGHRP
jgi:hypothetical protein